MSGALEGLRVVEIGAYVSAPFCTRLLADLGADVVKVEPPGGDPARHLGPGANGTSALFAYLNAGKASAVADLGEPSARAWFDDLLATADVLVENTEAGERDRFGLAFDGLLARHPHLVVVSLSPYGRSGPWAHRPGSDLTAQAASSLPYALGMPEREPVRIPYDQADYQLALHGAAAALAGVRERDRSGVGQAVDLSNAQVMAYCVGGMYLVTAKLGKPWERREPQPGALYPLGFFPCADGFVCVPAQTPKHWEQFVRMLRDLVGVAEGEAGEQYNPYVDVNVAAQGDFREWLMRLTRAELLDRALADGILFGVAQNVAEVLDSPQFTFRGAWAEIETGGAARRVVLPGTMLGATPIEVGRWAPELGPRCPVVEAVRGRVPTGSEAGERRPSLDGIRVLDFGWNWAGPMVGQLLADLGAEVIRVETTKRQDYMRFLDHLSPFFCHTNRSKLSARFNLAHPEGADYVRRLVTSADVVLDNFAAGVMARNGLGYDDLQPVKSDIVCVSLSMAGQEGPHRAMRGFASIATAYSGLELMVGYPDGPPTGLIPFGLGDTTMAIQAVVATLAALHHRDRTGEGQFIDVSQLECSAATMGEAYLDHQLTGKLPGGLANTHTWWSPHGMYPAAGDDRWVALAVRDEAEWSALCEVLGRADLAADASLASPQGRRAATAEIDDAIRAWCAVRDRDEAADVLASAGVPSAPLLTLAERDAHPQFAHLVLHHEGGGFDPCDIYATPWWFTATPPAMTRSAPALGEQDDYVYRDLLGLDDAEITRLREGRVLY